MREEILGQLNEILFSILGLRISSLGNILENKEGTIFFEKGRSIKFPYNNLSSGEKEVVDIVLDLIIRKNSHDDTVYCIDEPELHLNTSIQRKLLVEIVKLIPENCQLWIATHSIGFLRALQEELKSQVQIIDFSGVDFDSDIVLKPIKSKRGRILRFVRFS